MAYIRCSDATHQRVRIAAATLGITMQELLERAFDAFLKDDPYDQVDVRPPGSNNEDGIWHDALNEILISGIDDAVNGCKVSLTSMRLLVRHRKRLETKQI